MAWYFHNLLPRGRRLAAAGAGFVPGGRGSGGRHRGKGCAARTGEEGDSPLRSLRGDALCGERRVGGHRPDPGRPVSAADPQAPFRGYAHASERGDDPRAQTGPGHLQCHPEGGNRRGGTVAPRGDASGDLRSWEVRGDLFHDEATGDAHRTCRRSGCGG